jgi:ABC-type phosphate transport system auxiliary subunit
MPLDDNFEQHFARELAEGDKRMNSLTDEVAAIKLEQAQFRVLLKENTDATNSIKADTAELLEAFHSFKGALKVLEWIGKAAKPIGYIVGLCASVAAFWTAMKSGVSTK